MVVAKETVSRVGEPSTDLAGEITLGLSGSLNLRRTVLHLLTLIRPRLADWAMLVLPDNSGGLALYGGDSAGSHNVVARASVAATALGGVLRTGRTERLPLADGLWALIPDAALRAEAGRQGAGDMLGLGLTARGTTFGALVVVRGPNRDFSAHDIAVAEILAARAAVPLDSARLYEERGRIATALARSLRPPTLPEVAGLRLAARYRPAAEHLDLGGDFYDIHGSADDWLLSLGDVCGKGVEAAALTGRTRQSIRTAAYFDRRPARVLAALNTVLHETGSDPFVTVVCARVRPEHDGAHADVELAVAGHPAPLVLRSNGRVEQPEVSGTAAGMIPAVEYRSVTMRLERGDTMLMFTDGIDEAQGDRGLYGVDRLRALLPAYAGTAPGVVCEAVEQDVIEYLDGRPHDDMALLAVTCGRYT